MPTVWFDFETRGDDLRGGGAYRYAATADPILLAWAIDEGPIEIIENSGLVLDFDDFPPELRAAAVDPSFTFWAWNAGFDRAIWNYSLPGSPFLAPERVRDAMALAAASNLPRDLERASTVLTGAGKQEGGKALIGKFCGPDGDAAALAEPEEWARFVAYAVQDVRAMRAACRIMRPLPESEWAVFVANERINDRGIAVDMPFVEHAATLAAQEVIRTNRELSELTRGEITSIFQHIALASWIFDRLPDAESREIMTYGLKEPEEIEGEDDDGREPIPVLTIARGTAERLSDYLKASRSPDTVLRRVLELREFGASAAFKKFAAILRQHVNGRIYGQILFNGAAMTGRFSGRGVQPQNLTRKTLGLDDGDDYGTYEAPTVDLIADGCSLDALYRHGLGEVPARKLSLVVRPAIIAPEGMTLLKADYSQIEARMLPWLAADERTTGLLDAFRRMDTDPTAPDLYKVAASGMVRKPIAEISKEERQIGKVATLACGYQGGKGAFASMAAAYRLYVSPDEAQRIVDAWRAANPWAADFWGRHTATVSYGLMGAAMQAVTNPGATTRAGRIVFRFQSNYLGGTLFMRLPNGRLLTYPGCKWRTWQPKDKKTGELKEKREGLTFKRPEGVSAIYGGRLAENATQAAAADLLRESLVEIDLGYRDILRVIMHAHDEITAEVDEAQATLAANTLQMIMTKDRGWTAGLPLSVDVTARFYYSAAKVRAA